MEQLKGEMVDYVEDLRVFPTASFYYIPVLSCLDVFQKCIELERRGRKAVDTSRARNENRSKNAQRFGSE